MRTAQKPELAGVCVRKTPRLKTRDHELFVGSQLSGRKYLESPYIALQLTSARRVVAFIVADAVAANGDLRRIDLTREI
jgi:hypothetical protein